MCGISRQAGQEAKVYSELYICCDTYPAYLEPQCSHPASPLRFCVQLLKQGTDSSDCSTKAISVSGHNQVLQLEQALKFTELECK